MECSSLTVYVCCNVTKVKHLCWNTFVEIHGNQVSKGLGFIRAETHKSLHVLQQRRTNIQHVQVQYIHTYLFEMSW